MNIVGNGAEEIWIKSCRGCSTVWLYFVPRHKGEASVMVTRNLPNITIINPN